MDKLARKPSGDPAQEKLRKDKDVWNKQVSQFIENVKQVKKTMNGFPSKMNPQKGNIKNPLPPSVPSALEALTQNFNEIAQNGEAIVEEQLAYSKNRRKSPPKMSNPPQTPNTPAGETSPPTATDLSKQLTAFEQKYELITEASNPVSRFFTKLLNPTFGFGEAARIRRVRMQLLKACAETYKKLGKLQVDVVKSSKTSIESSNNLMHEAWRNWETVRTGFNTYKSMMPVQVPDAGGILEEPKDVKKEESKSVEKEMEKVDRAQETGGPEPGDPDYEKPPDTESSKNPDWIGGTNYLVDELHKEQVKTLAREIIKDTRIANQPTNLYLFYENGITPDALNALNEVTAWFGHGTRPDLAPQVLSIYRETLDHLNSQLGTHYKSLKDIAEFLKKSKALREQAAKQQARLEALQRKEQAKQQKILQKEEEAAQKEQVKIKNQLEQAKQKSLMHNPPPSSAASDQLEATAQAFLKKWIGKTRHQMSIFDDTSSQRLQIFDMAGEMRKTVNDIMDHLEKDIKVDVMVPLVDKANRQITTIRSLTRNLHNTHKPAPKGKKPPGFLDRMKKIEDLM